MGMEVIITTSHSAPYQTDDASVAVDLVKSWCNSENVDYLSPQLYSSGMEGSPELDETSSCINAGCTWELYKPEVCNANFAPSIVDETHLEASINFFKQYGIEFAGYLVWAQNL
mmetsp:Transcript_12623/g.25746  ORF Transcript_12623/g.25746 Transcript_12623/m.25746 type:complete len:114 (-) Transcript_12623:34-375(-)